jgi:hypothetical protein
MRASGVRFSVAAHAAWAPGATDVQAWKAWAGAPFPLSEGAEPGARQMPAMLRRRAGFLGKMALEAAYQCLGGQRDVPCVFVSRHGEVSRAVELLGELAQNIPLSPTGFGLAVHNASAGLFSIARADRANHIALAAGDSSTEHAVIEACALLADGAPMVLLVVYDCPLPPVFANFADGEEQPHAWAWLMTQAQGEAFGLEWTAAQAQDDVPAGEHGLSPGLEVLRFYLNGDDALVRVAGPRRWCWSRDA